MEWKHFLLSFWFVICVFELSSAEDMEGMETSLLLKRIMTSREHQKAPLRHKRHASDKPTIRSLHMESRIENRLAESTFTSIVENTSEEDDKEAVFTVQIPEDAFISNFTMFIDGELFVAEIKEKVEAQVRYDEAKEQNQTAGHVRSIPRDLRTAARGMEIFSVAVNLAPGDSVEFVLSSQEILKRQRGVYKHITSVRPMQIVEDLTYRLNINEESGITLLTQDGPNAEHSRKYDNINDVTEYTIENAFSSEAQIKMDPETGFNSDIIVTYDINHQDGIGDIKNVGDVVINSFSPKNLVALPKNIVFVIDISGSMSGDKIEQTLSAMLTILDQLKTDDLFSLILFDGDLTLWPTEKGDYDGELQGKYEYEQELDQPIRPPASSYPIQPRESWPPGEFRPRGVYPSPCGLAAKGSSDYLIAGRDFYGVETSEYSKYQIRNRVREVTGLVQANQNNIQKAKAFSEKYIRAVGSTNIHDALLVGTELLKSLESTNGNSIVFLTDGDPTSGLTQPDAIVESITARAKATETSSSVQIFSLGFGFNLNYDLLEMLSKNTDAMVKRIYADADAASQLRDFYDKIGTPVLYGVDFLIDENIIDLETVSKTKYSQYFNGSDIMIVGKLKKDLPGDRRKKRSTSEGTFVTCCFGMVGIGYDNTMIDYHKEVEINIPLDSEERSEEAEVDCFDNENNEIDMAMTSKSYSYAERIWANLKIKDLLRISDITKDSNMKKKAKRQATCLALKYHLVTPVTSLLIVQDNIEPANNGGGERGLAAGPQGRSGPAQGFPVGPSSVGQGLPAQRGYPGQAGLPIGQAGLPIGQAGLPGGPGYNWQSPNIGPPGPGFYPQAPPPTVSWKRPTTTRTTTTRRPTTTQTTTTRRPTTTQTTTKRKPTTTQTTTTKPPPSTTTSTPSTKTTTQIMSNVKRPLRLLSGFVFEGNCSMVPFRTSVSYYQVFSTVNGTDNTANTTLKATVTANRTQPPDSRKWYKFMIELPVNSHIYTVSVRLTNGTKIIAKIGRDSEALKACTGHENNDSNMSRYSLEIRDPNYGYGAKMQVTVDYEEKLVRSTHGTYSYRTRVWQNDSPIDFFVFYLVMNNVPMNTVTIDDRELIPVSSIPPPQSGIFDQMMVHERSTSNKNKRTSVFGTKQDLRLSKDLNIEYKN